MSSTTARRMELGSSDCLPVPSPTSSATTTPSSELIGPFITVVSVDGGIQCGNKLTVITPTEISESSKFGQEAMRTNNNNVSNNTIDNSNPQHGQATSELQGVHASVVGKAIDIECNNENNNNNNNDESCSGGGATYVTVLALGKKSGEQRENQSPPTTNKKSIVNISSNGSPSSVNKNDDGIGLGGTQIVTISNKALVTGKESLSGKNSSIVEICKSLATAADVDDDDCDDMDIPQEIKENVVVYRLPGERLGFGLRFDGGVTNPKENVRHLFIQSCADNSPAIRAQTSWGHLVEGDEVLTIESTPVSSMTRMDCVQCLKDASVAVRLYVRHIYTAEEISFLQAQRKLAIEKRQRAFSGSGGVNKSQGAFPCQISENAKVTSESSSSSSSTTKLENSPEKSSAEEVNFSRIENGVVSENDMHKNSSSGCLSEPEIVSLQRKINGNAGTTNDEESGVTRCASIIPNKGQEQMTTIKGDELVKLKLQPPVGFADEFDNINNNNNNTEGQNSPLCPSSPHNRIPSLNDGILGPDSPQIYMNAIDPTVMMMLMNGSVNGSNQQGGFGSLANFTALNMSHLNLSLTGSSSSLSVCESDETGSTRSTVVSRLSMASSMTSISAMAIPMDNSCGTITMSSSNSVIVTHSNNNNNNNTNGSDAPPPLMNTGAVCVSATAKCKSGQSTNPNNHTLEQDSFHQLQQQPHQLGLVVNNVRTIPCSADAEIPLEPPLSFQDQQELLLLGNDSNNASASNNPSPVNVYDEHRSMNEENDQEDEDEEDEVRRATADTTTKLRVTKPDTNKTKIIYREQTSLNKYNGNNTRPTRRNDANESGANPGKEDVWKNTLESHREKDELKETHNLRRDNTVASGSIATLINDDENNHNSSSVSSDDDDEDELALLADELGLEQFDEEDEQLFAALVAETDKENFNKSDNNDSSSKSVNSSTKTTTMMITTPKTKIHHINNPNGKMQGVHGSNDKEDDDEDDDEQNHELRYENSKSVNENHPDGNNTTTNGNEETLMANNNNNKGSRSRNTLIPRWIAKKKDELGPQPCEMIKSDATDPAAVLIAKEKSFSTMKIKAEAEDGNREAECRDKTTLVYQPKPKPRQGNAIKTVCDELRLAEKQNSAKTNEDSMMRSTARHVGNNSAIPVASSLANKELIDVKTNGCVTKKNNSQNKNVVVVTTAEEDFDQEELSESTLQQYQHNRALLFESKAVEEGNSLFYTPNTESTKTATVIPRYQTPHNNNNINSEQHSSTTTSTMSSSSSSSCIPVPRTAKRGKANEPISNKMNNATISSSTYKQGNTCASMKTHLQFPAEFNGGHNPNKQNSQVVEQEDQESVTENTTASHCNQSPEKVKATDDEGEKKKMMMLMTNMRSTNKMLSKEVEHCTSAISDASHYENEDDEDNEGSETVTATAPTMMMMTMTTTENTSNARLSNDDDSIKIKVESMQLEQKHSHNENTAENNNTLVTTFSGLNPCPAQCPTPPPRAKDHHSQSFFTGISVSTFGIDGGERRKSVEVRRSLSSTGGDDKWQLSSSSDGLAPGTEQVVIVGEGAVVRLQVDGAAPVPQFHNNPIDVVNVTLQENIQEEDEDEDKFYTEIDTQEIDSGKNKAEDWEGQGQKTDQAGGSALVNYDIESAAKEADFETQDHEIKYVHSAKSNLQLDPVVEHTEDESLEGTTLNGSSEAENRARAESLEQDSESEESGNKMDMDSTELLHFVPPPTFSRLPPDGDEFPNSWADEQTLKNKYDNKKLFRSEFSIKDIKISSKIGSPPPPPLPVSEPPREDTEASMPPPLPVSVPPLPPKTLLSRRSSVEDRKRLFEQQQAKKGMPGSNNLSANNNLSSSNNSFTQQKPLMTSSINKTQEPSKKSVRDKIAMFSSRSSSSEDSADTAFTKPLTTATSSLPRSNGITSKSSENLLSGVGMSLSSGNSSLHSNGVGSLSKINRSSALDLPTTATSSNSATLPTRKGSMDVTRMMNKTNAFYETLHSTAPPVKISNNLHERSQSMIDVGGGAENSYQNQNVSSYRYGNPTGGSRPLSTSSMMEQRRKCMTKLRGLVIPDVPKTDAADQINAKNMKTLNPTSASVADLPTIISKDSVIPPQFSSAKPPLSTTHHNRHQIVTRTESFEGISDDSNPNNQMYSRLLNGGRNSLTSNNTSAKGGGNNSTHQNNSVNIVSQIESDFSDWKFPNALPKYSPAFKRRSLTPYQSSLSSPTLKTKTISTTTTITSSITPNTYSKPTSNNTKNTTNDATSTPEPKSLESLTSPRSDSSFEFSSPSPPAENGKMMKPTRKQSFDKQQLLTQNNATPEETKEKATNQTVSNGDKGKYNGKGKLEDSDNDSAVSSSRSSISHGLSPRNSPTPEESSSTPDPDHEHQMSNENGRSHRMNEEGEEGEDSANSDEGWRILKPTSVEAINRKNVLTSAKLSSGGGRGNDGDGHSSASSNGKHRRSDEEEAGYADAEAEDTESSCSELEVSKSQPRRHNMIVAGRINIGGRRNSKADTEEEDVYVDVDVDDVEIERQSPPSHSQQSSVDLGDLILPDLTESPLQAIFDMEVKMAYINEICDALPGSGRSDSISSSRYFSRRDSEATVIERPIEPTRKLSVDQIDSADRRARNRSSSGNESDFSSSISVGSQNQINSISNSTANSKPEDRWSLLEKKYSKSMTAVNLLAQKPEPPQPTLTPAASVPKIVTAASEVVEKKIERIIEKSSLDALNKKTVGSKVIPRGRNDFKSLSEKWQQLSADGKPLPPSKTHPTVSEKLSLSPQNSIAPAVPTPGLRTRLTSPPPASPPKSLLMKTNSADLLVETPRQQQRPALTPKPASIVNSETIVKTKIDNEVIDQAREADIAWAAEKRRNDVTQKSISRHLPTESTMMPMSSAKRSVSVNDIRKAFEKAEIAVNYGRDDNGATNKKESSGLTLPSAHFRVSSFDSTTSEDSSATTPAGIYGSVNSLVSSAPRDPYGSITSLASSTSLISPQELQQLIDEANQSLEEAGTPSHEVSVVILHREFAGGSLGITLAGGADYETKEITVHKVLTGSIADRDGRVHRGDRILSINGKSTKGLTHRDALNLLKAPRTEVVLVVSRGRTASNGFQTIEETSATLDRAVEPLLNATIAGLLDQDEDSAYKWGPLRTVILTKDGAGLGFSLEGGKGSIHGDKPLTVKKIFIGGPAEKSGDLKVGDLITSINNVNVSSKSRTEAWNFMKKIGDGDVKITVRSPV